MTQKQTHKRKSINNRENGDGTRAQNTYTTHITHWHQKHTETTSYKRLKQNYKHKDK